MRPDVPVGKHGVQIISLVSVGAHPTSGRARRAEQDARAVELGLQLVGDNLQVLHAGNPAEPALRAYLGMGLSELHVLEQPDGADALAALTDYIRDSGAQMVLAGSQAETGEGSGMLPFLLAEGLGWPLVTGLAEVESLSNGTALVLQALPRGQRRRLKVRLPFLATVDNAAPAPRQSAYGPAQRGILDVDKIETVIDDLFTAQSLQPAKPRPKRLKVIKAKSGADRMKAATAKASGGSGQVLKGLSPEESAAAILKLLIDEGVVR
ncbi:electron transfer flavoprotein subunit beta [Pseudomonas syringae pv. tomato]|uniref:Electron transfer flavoprotein subunit beta n=2 Tax=Pseudomonas syringae group TaxID=136849 RepID=A0AAW4DWK4_PSESX|nr:MULTISPECIES: electron transfer flavoprotein subunit beta [Pseudomonas syringae group]AVI82651.1 electron transfer flavoprotein subunit beta [Pseudomonas syringae pv. tomato]EEB61152.1 electron transfer flavoprotein, beta subunit [Pseudomonas syringae pv. tomato T1]KGK96567.1 electron transfer flavoprotein subunit beta [Pseudomonas syringae pv. tomato]KPB84131.1 Electron transfer flavoprotein [Pseudomonas syringae pv. maculicola]KPW32573.1 Electron transfer flavoprotein, beta subunit [Pseud